MPLPFYVLSLVDFDFWSAKNDNKCIFHCKLMILFWRNILSSKNKYTKIRCIYIRHHWLIRIFLNLNLSVFFFNCCDKCKILKAIVKIDKHPLFLLIFFCSNTLCSQFHRFRRINIPLSCIWVAFAVDISAENKIKLHGHP